MLSKIKPEKKDCTAHKKNNTLTTKVGILPTNPVCKYCIKTGIKNAKPIPNIIAATIEKKANGL